MSRNLQDIYPKLVCTRHDLGLIWRDWQEVPAPDVVIAALFWAAERSDFDP